MSRDGKLLFEKNAVEERWVQYIHDLYDSILFILYTQPLSNVIKQYPVFHQMYADDTQIYKSCRPSEIVYTINSIEQCISNVKNVCSTTNCK